MERIKKILSKFFFGQSDNKTVKKALVKAKQAQDIGNETIIDFQKILKDLE